MVDNEADSVKVSESAEPPLCIFKVYIITIMGHLNIPLLSLLYRQKTDLPQDSMTPLSPFPMWNFLFFHMKDAFFFLLRCRRCPRTSSHIAYTSHLEGRPSLRKFFSASAPPALVRFSSSLPFPSPGEKNYIIQHTEGAPHSSMLDEMLLFWRSGIRPTTCCFPSGKLFSPIPAVQKDFPSHSFCRFLGIPPTSSPKDPLIGPPYQALGVAHRLYPIRCSACTDRAE